MIVAKGTRVALRIFLLRILWATSGASAFLLRPAAKPLPRVLRDAPATPGTPLVGNETSVPTESRGVSNGGTRWTDSGRWEAPEAPATRGGGSYLLKEKYGTYFQVPNPATLMTKIICTIGPATSDPTTLGRMMDAGMTAARINMSHGGSDYTAAAEIIDNIRAVAETRQKLCPIILDTKGPEIRVCWLGAASEDLDGEAETDADDAGDPPSPRPLRLQSGAPVLLMTGAHLHQNEDGTASIQKDAPENLSPRARTIPQRVAVTYPYLAQAVAQGDVVLLDDGRISLIVVEVLNDNEVLARVIEGGILVNNKGVNLPGCHVEVSKPARCLGGAIVSCV